MLEAGADKNTGNQHGITALMAAAENGHLEVVQLLIKSRANKNAAASNGATWGNIFVSCSLL